MAAAGQHHEAPVANIDDDGLIVANERVGLEQSVAYGVMRWRAALEVIGAGDLASHQHRTLQNKRRPLVFDEFKASVPQTLTRWWHRSRLVSIWVQIDPRQICVWMKRQWKCQLSQPRVQPDQAKRVIPVAVRQHDAAQIFWLHSNAVHVVDQPIGAAARVEQERT